MLANEAGAPSAQILPVPQDGGGGDDDDPLKMMKSDLANAKGKLVMTETTSGGWSQGTPNAPKGDWEQRRIGPDWPEVLRKTRLDIEQSVYAACSVPAVLMDKRAEGTSQREGLRRFAHLGLEPLARIVEAELADKLETAVHLDFAPLMASDLAGKARAIKGMVEAGLALDKALEIAGVE